MSETYWTLIYNTSPDPIEKSFADWEIAEDWTLRFVSQAPDMFECNIITDADSEDFPFEAEIEIWSDRVWDDITQSFSGGTRRLVAKRKDRHMLGSGSEEKVAYTFAGPWWDLERTMFHQVRRSWNNGTSSLDDIPTTQVNLGQKITGVSTWELQNNGEQVSECLTWAIDAGVDLQIGTIDPDTEFPVTPANDIMVSEAIKTALRWTADVVTVIDYTTTPPTIHARKGSSLSATSIDASGISNLDTLNLTPRDDLVLPGVVLKFKQLNESNGISYVTVVEQKYPAGADPQNIGVFSATVEMQGVSTSYATAEVDSALIDADNTTEANRIAWWKLYDPLLRSNRVTDISIDVATFTDKDGNTLSGLTNFPYALVSGQIAPWMEVGGVAPTTKDVVVNAKGSFKIWTDSNHQHLASYPDEYQFTTTVAATNRAPGTYTQLVSALDAEPIPSGLAQDIYDAHSALQYEGVIQLTDDDPVYVSMASTITITGLATSISGVRIQSVVIGAHSTSVSLGPATQLGLSDLIELSRVNRTRAWFRLTPAERVNGQMGGGGGGNIGLGKSTPKENTVKDLSIPRVMMVSSPLSGAGRTAVVMDMNSGSSESIAFGDFLTDGSPDTSIVGRVRIERARFGLNSGLDIRLREARVCYADGTEKLVMILASDVYDGPPLIGDTPIGGDLTP